MGKKNIFIGLSTLLLVLLLGLFTTSYAYEYDITQDNYDEFFNYYNNVTWYNNTSANTVKRNFLNDLSNQLNYDNAILYVYRTSNGQYSIYFYFFNNINVTNFTYTSPTNWSLTCANIKRIAVTDNHTDTVSRVSHDSRGNYFMICNDLGTLTAPFQSKNVMTFIDPGPQIRFEPYPTKISDVYVGQNYNLTAYGCNINNTYVSMRFGDLIQPPSFLIEEIDVTMSYYNRGQSKWIEKYLLIETGEDLVPSNYKSSIANFKWENYEDYTITFSAFINNEYVHDDCLYTFSFIGKDTSGTPFYIEQTFYIIGSNTVITNGTLDISFLETGDYSNDYANDLNELASKIDDQNDLINAVEQGNINSWLPGSGDWSSLIGLVGSGDDIINTANLWGFRNYTNSYWASLYEMMNATYTVLSQTGTVALDVSFHGYNHAITSADIPSPPLPIKNTISLCLITFVMISIYKSFSKKIEKLKMIDTSVLKSEAHDDSDLM